MLWVSCLCCLVAGAGYLVGVKASGGKHKPPTHEGVCTNRLPERVYTQTAYPGVCMYKPRVRALAKWPSKAEKALSVQHTNEKRCKVMKIDNASPRGNSRGA